MVFSAASFLIKDTAQQITTSIITLTDKDINKNLHQYIDSSVMYKLPSTVKDTDDISVIIRVKQASLLDAYEAGKKEVSFTEYAYSAEAGLIADKILAEKSELLSALDDKNINYTTGADYKAIFGGFEVVIKAGEFEALCKTLGNRAAVIVGDEYNTCETQLVENAVDVFETGIFDSSDSGYDGSGMVVAVLDTGIDSNHSAFSTDNFTSQKL